MLSLATCSETFCPSLESYRRRSASERAGPVTHPLGKAGTLIHCVFEHRSRSPWLLTGQSSAAVVQYVLKHIFCAPTDGHHYALCRAVSLLSLKPGFA